MDPLPVPFSDVLQYGAFGLLSIIIFWGLRALSSIADKFVGSLDNLNTTLKVMNESIHDTELKAEQRHGDLRAWFIGELATSRNISDEKNTMAHNEIMRRLDKIESYLHPERRKREE